MKILNFGIFQCNKVMNNLFAYRDDQFKIAASAPITDAGMYTSVNLNRIYVRMH
jgi:hypothetical protein